ncbi:hypothetical protein V3O24_08150 [Methylobacter sp. Wu8]
MSDEAKTALLKECIEADQRLDSRAVWAKYQTLHKTLEQRLAALTD